MFPTLYGKSSSGKLLVWEIYVEGDSYFVRFGQLGSDKIQLKQTVCKAKNVGRANSTTPEEQAVIEAKAKHTLQQKKGYYLTKEEAIGHIDWHPMKLTRYDEQSHKIVFPAYIQPKLDGQKGMVDQSGKGVSKQGESISFPEHISAEIEILKEALGSNFKGLDGEIYAGLVSEGGLELQDIISAFRKPNSNTPKLKYYVYDIPDANEPFSNRKARLDQILCIITLKGLTNIAVVPTVLVTGVEELKAVHKMNASLGYEGTVVRNQKGLYEFGKRSYDAQKIKDRRDTEAYVQSVEVDKNGQGVLTCCLENGVQFKALMKKDADKKINLRLYENAVKLVDSWVTVEYESLSKDGVPLKPVGVAVREVNSLTWESK